MEDAHKVRSKMEGKRERVLKFPLHLPNQEQIALRLRIIEGTKSERHREALLEKLIRKHPSSILARKHALLFASKKAFGKSDRKLWADVALAAAALLALLQKSFQLKALGPIGHPPSSSQPSPKSLRSDDKGAEKAEDADMAMEDDVASVLSDVTVEEIADPMELEEDVKKQKEVFEVEGESDSLPQDTPLVTKDDSEESMVIS